MNENEEEITARVLDRLRGNPLQRMKDLAEDSYMTLEEFLVNIDHYIRTGQKVDSFAEPESIERLWSDYELITGNIVPPERRGTNPIECCA